MSDVRLAAQIAFLNEADKLKKVSRANYLMDGSRPENSAEHSWHLALWALAFEPMAPAGVDVNRVIQMLLLHDLVEIDVGDHPIDIETDWQSVTLLEQQAAHRLFGLLPEDQTVALAALWFEFEAEETPDAQFAKVLDRCQPLFQVLHAANPRRDHLDVVRQNLSSGRAAYLKNTYPAFHGHAVSLLERLPFQADPDLYGRLSFLSEADRLKSVLRATRILDASRRENSGEHSWHIALYALILAEHANRPVNVDRVVKMLLIHDLVEIDVGDVPVHAQGGTAHGSAETQAAEARAADRIFGLLPDDQRDVLRSLWDEFEAAETDNAVFAKSVDRVQPVICNLETGGGTWPEFNVTRQQLEDRVGWKVEKGALALWTFLKVRIADWFTANSSPNP